MSEGGHRLVLRDRSSGIVLLHETAIVPVGRSLVADRKRQLTPTTGVRVPEESRVGWERVCGRGWCARTMWPVTSRIASPLSADRYGKYRADSLLRSSKSAIPCTPVENGNVGRTEVRRGGGTTQRIGQTFILLICIVTRTRTLRTRSLRE